MTLRSLGAALALGSLHTSATSVLNGQNTISVAIQTSKDLFIHPGPNRLKLFQRYFPVTVGIGTGNTETRTMRRWTARRVRRGLRAHTEAHGCRQYGCNYQNLLATHFRHSYFRFLLRLPFC